MRVWELRLGRACCLCLEHWAVAHLAGYRMQHTLHVYFRLCTTVHRAHMQVYMQALPQAATLSKAAGGAGHMYAAAGKTLCVVSCLLLALASYGT